MDSGISEGLRSAMQETAERIAKQAKTAERSRMIEWLKPLMINKAIATEHSRGWNEAVAHIASHLETL